ncbi:hypothetical protein BH24CHL4_BH24CHL4_12230 [soil metagenome]
MSRLKGKLSAKAKLRAYFTEHVGEVLTSDALREVGGISEWARRVRELRDEEGLDIVTHHDLAMLKPNEYMLRSHDMRPAFSRAISKETRALVLDRNGYTCQMCGASAGEIHPYDPARQTRLHIGHVLDKSLGGTDVSSNLRAICSVCNEGAANITLPRPEFLKLKTQVRRAPEDVQIDIMTWLLEKFPDESSR